MKKLSGIVAILAIVFALSSAFTSQLNRTEGWYAAISSTIPVSAGSEFQESNYETTPANLQGATPQEYCGTSEQFLCLAFFDGEQNDVDAVQLGEIPE